MHLEIMVKYKNKMEEINMLNTALGAGAKMLKILFEQRCTHESMEEY